jgi:hypothetical protein
MSLLNRVNPYTSLVSNEWGRFGAGLIDAALARDVENACLLLIEHCSVTEANVPSALKEQPVTP